MDAPSPPADTSTTTLAASHHTQTTPPSEPPTTTTSISTDLSPSTNNPQLPQPQPPPPPSPPSPPPPYLTTPPTPAQLLTITPTHLLAIRLLYPGLRALPVRDLREALYAHRRELVAVALAAHARVERVERGSGDGDGDGRGKGEVQGRMESEGVGGRKRKRGDENGIGDGEVRRYREEHPGAGWMSDEGVRAAAVFEKERGRWLREGWLVDSQGGSGEGGCADSLVALGLRRGVVLAAPGVGDAEGVMETLRVGATGLVEEVEDEVQGMEMPSFEPSDREVWGFQAQCASIAGLEERHVRSVVCYLRERRWRREMRDRLVGVLKGLEREMKMEGRDLNAAVPVKTIRERIVELMRQDAMVQNGVARRANAVRVEELRRLLEVAWERQVGAVEHWPGVGMIDKAVQTRSVPASVEEQVLGLTALPHVDGPAQIAANTVESDTDEDDGGVDLDEESYYSGETIESEDYRNSHDLMEEFHGRLI